MNAAEILASLDRLGFQAARLLAGVLWQSTLLFAAIAVVAWALRRKSPALRHTLWAAAICAAPFLPLLTVGFSKAQAPQAAVRVLPEYEPPAEAAMVLPAPVELAAPQDIAAMPQSAPAPGAASEEIGLMNFPWAVLVVAYAGGAAAFLLWVVLGHIRIRAWMCGAAVPAGGRIAAAFAAAAAKLGVRGRFRVLESHLVPAPFSAGAFRPAVLLPEGFAEGLSDEELAAVALHETAHIARRDALVLSVVALVRAVLFFHPFVWFAARRASLLAEEAADDAVLRARLEPLAYARTLVRIAEGLKGPIVSAEVAAGIVLSRGTFLRRVEAILCDKRDRMRKTSRLIFAGAAAAAVVSLALALSAPLGDKAASSSSDGKSVNGAGPTLPSTDSVLPAGYKIIPADEKDRLSMEEEERESGGIARGQILLGFSRTDGEPLPDRAMLVIKREKYTLNRPCEIPSGGEVKANAPAGSVLVYVFAEGCTPTVAGPFDVPAKAVLVGPEIRLTAAKPVTFAISTADGRKPAGGFVEIYWPEDSREKAGILRGATLLWRVPITEKGEAVLAACPGFPVHVQVIADGFEETLIENVTLATGALKVNVEPAEPVKLRLVDGATDWPVPGAKVTFYHVAAPFETQGPPIHVGGGWTPAGDEEIAAEPVSDADGMLTLASLRGGLWRYWLEITAGGYAPEIRGPVRAGDDLGEIRLVPPIVVSGEIIAPPEVLEAVKVTGSNSWSCWSESRDVLASTYWNFDVPTTWKAADRRAFSVPGQDGPALHPGAVRVTVDFGALGKQVFHRVTSQSIMDLVITPEGITENGKQVQSVPPAPVATDPPAAPPRGVTGDTLARDKIVPAANEDDASTEEQDDEDDLDMDEQLALHKADPNAQARVLVSHLADPWQRKEALLRLVAVQDSIGRSSKIIDGVLGEGKLADTGMLVTEKSGQREKPPTYFGDDASGAVAIGYLALFPYVGGGLIKVPASFVFDREGRLVGVLPGEEVTGARSGGDKTLWFITNQPYGPPVYWHLVNVYRVYRTDGKTVEMQLAMRTGLQSRLILGDWGTGRVTVEVTDAAGVEQGGIYEYDPTRGVFKGSTGSILSTCNTLSGSRFSAEGQRGADEAYILSECNTKLREWREDSGESAKGLLAALSLVPEVASKLGDQLAQFLVDTSSGDVLPALAAGLLCEIRDPETLGRLEQVALDSGSWPLAQANAVLALGRMGDKTRLDKLTALAERTGPDRQVVRLAAIRALALISGDAAVTAADKGPGGVFNADGNKAALAWWEKRFETPTK